MKRQKITQLLFALCAAAFLASAGMLVCNQYSYRESEKEYRKLARSVVGTGQAAGKTVPADRETEGASGGKEKEATGEEPPLLEIDFDALLAVNGDTVAWIDFPGQDISYPVVQGEDNEKYLSRTFGGSPNRAGSIFLDCRNTGVMTDGSTILYGHNMKNGSMFGRLKKYLDQSWQEKFPFFDVYTPEGAYRCRIIMAGNVPAESRYYPVAFADEKERSRYLRRMKENAPYDIPVPDGGADAAPLVLLSTCTGDGYLRRLVLLGQAIYWLSD